jgi:pimeloyl-ACP methyl ester carboxylesterase
MAAIAFPKHAKLLTLSTGHTYNYVYFAPRSPFWASILLLHGFPSSCYDWRHQIAFFASYGYGVLAPDLLGYGGTSKPSSPEEYKAKNMAAEITEILDHEKIQRVHAVAHDTGSILLSRFVNYHPERLLSCTFLAVPYSKPRETFDLEAINAMTKQLVGKEKFGYLEFFIRDDAGDLLDQRVSHLHPKTRIGLCMLIPRIMIRLIHFSHFSIPQVQVCGTTMLGRLVP